MEQINSKQFVNSALYKFVETVSKQGVSLIISLVLARLLMPEHYGIIALTTVFITFSNIFIQNSFNIALIRKDEVKPTDYSTVMCLNLSFAVLLYIGFFFAAPFVADYYKIPELKWVLRVITILLFFESCATVERVKATRAMQFRLMSIVTFSSNALAGSIGILMAYLGFGIWALVAQQVIYNFLDMILMTILLKWKFSLKFSRSSAKELFGFSLGVLGSSFLDFAGNNIPNLVIGKIYSTKALGYLNKGYMLPEQIYLYTYNTINSVTLPTLASRQSNIESMKAVVRRIVSMTTYLIFPLMGGLLIVAPRLIPFLLTDKWLSCIPLLQWCCLIYSFNTLRSINANVFFAIGKSKVCFRIELIRCLLLLTVMVFVLCVFNLNIYVFVASNACVSLIVALITQFWAKKYIGYKYREMFSDINPSLVLTVIMAVFVYFIGYLPITDTPLLFVQILFGSVVYILLSMLFKIKSFDEVVQIAKGMLKKKYASEDKHFV